jgi:hypothetical protein
MGFPFRDATLCEQGNRDDTLYGTRVGEIKSCVFGLYGQKSIRLCPMGSTAYRDRSRPQATKPNERQTGAFAGRMKHAKKPVNAGFLMASVPDSVPDQR